MVSVAPPSVRVLVCGGAWGPGGWILSVCGTTVRTHLKEDPRVNLSGMYNRLKEAYVRVGCHTVSMRMLTGRRTEEGRTNAWGFSRSRAEEPQEEVSAAPLSRSSISNGISTPCMWVAMGCWTNVSFIECVALCSSGTKATTI